MKKDRKPDVLPSGLETGLIVERMLQKNYESSEPKEFEISEGMTEVKKEKDKDWSPGECSVFGGIGEKDEYQKPKGSLFFQKTIDRRKK